MEELGTVMMRSKDGKKKEKHIRVTLECSG